MTERARMAGLPAPCAVAPLKREKKKNVGVHYLRNFRSVWIKFRILPQPVGLLKFKPNLFYTKACAEFILCK